MMMEVLPEEKYFPLKISRKMNADFYGSASFGHLKQFMELFSNWYNELAENRRGFSPFNIANHKPPLSNWVKGNTLKAMDDSYYLLQMIKESNKETRDENHDNQLRHYLNFTYKAINYYTHNIETI